MSAHCCAGPGPDAVDPRYRRILWIALVINAAMFFVEIAGSYTSGSVSLLADSVDFFGDAANYALSLAVLSMALAWRARAALVKGISMGLFGVFVLGKAVWVTTQGATPEPITMGMIGALALAANVGVAVMLYAYRSGDANMRSVWLCTRNDAIGNVAVMLAAIGVFGTGSAWPDLAVAAIMGTLALSAARTVIGEAQLELQNASHYPPAHKV
ncbi:MAG: cation transporter [Burkholderiales bacterium]|nr:cation transporter [Burkholderiales bacterium]